jgi:serine protease Do
MRKFRWSTAFLIAAAAGILLIGSGVLEIDVNWRDGAAARALNLFGSGETEKKAAPAEPFWTEGKVSPPVSAPEGAPSSFADLAERTSPAVVNIQTSRTVGGPTGPEGPEGPGGQGRPRHPLEEFFGPFGPPFEELFEQPRKVPSLGTGFVISPDGFILTNNHVIEDVDKIEVQFEDGNKYDAKVVGRDPRTDVALIRVEPKQPLPSLPLGDSESVRPGDWVVAIGNPFGLSHTVTAGIVSARHREINADPDARRFDDFIQTDAAINPGNSGGPLISLSGEVIGINTAINPRANTIGFAVPINIAKDVLPQLRASGKVSRGWLGVYIQPIEPEMAEILGLQDTKGALVSKVEPGSPADEAGLKSGDVVVEFNGKSIEKMEELPRYVASAGVGKKLELVALRKGQRKSFDVTLGELDAEVKEAAATPGEEHKPKLGLSVQDLSPELAQQLGMEDAKGVIVTKVEADSPADEAGIRPADEAGIRRRDVILEVNQHPVASAREFAKAVEDAGKGALLLVRRGEAEIFVAVKPG